MNRLALAGMLVVLMAGCASAPWGWRDTRVPARESAGEDLAACRSYASSQYRPGIPAGDPYLGDQAATTGRSALDDVDQNTVRGAGPWHPDRDPLEQGLSRDSLHGVPVPHTGYPGYLDYHPGFLDALVEKCMSERGWLFGPAEGTGRK